MLDQECQASMDVGMGDGTRMGMLPALENQSLINYLLRTYFSAILHV